MTAAGEGRPHPRDGHAYRATLGSSCCTVCGAGWFAHLDDVDDLDDDDEAPAAPSLAAGAIGRGVLDAAAAGNLPAWARSSPPQRSSSTANLPV